MTLNQIASFHILRVTVLYLTSILYITFKQTHCFRVTIAIFILYDIMTASWCLTTILMLPRVSLVLLTHLLFPSFNNEGRYANINFPSFKAKVRVDLYALNATYVT